jgi:LCP family protein required for cell wall assembly
VVFALLTIFLVIVGFAAVRIWKYLSIGVQVVTNNKIELKQDEEKRVNLLLLGVGGGTHEGPDLTDTVIFASIDPKSKEVLLVSIPRDLWVPEIQAKINHAYIYGEEKEAGKGLLMAKAMVGKIVGQDIEYAIKIDFNGFVKAVDEIGGLDVAVERTFDDYAYPISGKEIDPCGHDEVMIASFSAQIATGSATESEFFPCRYEHLHFDEGQTHMDGITALKFVRSRHAFGPEGSDFARSKRQEKIIAAFKDKIFSLEILLNPGRVLELVDVVRDSIDINIKEDEYDDFIRLAQKFKEAKITSATVDTGDYVTGREGLLTIPSSSEEFRGHWVLIPAAGNGDYSRIQEYVACKINKGTCDVTPTPEISPSL